MFGWFRKRQRPAAATVDAVAAQPAERASASLPQGQPAAAPALDFAAAREAASARETGIADGATSAQIFASARASAAERAEAPAEGALVTNAGTSPSAPVDAHHAAAAAAAVASPQAPGPLAAPSLRPAMPLSDHPNFAGLGLAQTEHEAPRLLDPEAALTDDARDALTTLLLDMFGPRGRYRLEWRADRQPGDDAMFSQIMVADLVRRIQNSIATSADLELRAMPLPLAIEAVAEHPSLRDDTTSPADGDDSADASTDAEAESAGEPAADGAGDAADAALSEAEREAAIEQFLSPAETLEQLAAATHPEPGAGAAADFAPPHADRRIA